uniref:Proteasome assembly chaperone 3 n=1 Tax=Parastrongyloides trichosuri TaxID=131310 RepID=A0A0N4Z6R3_PARTI
MAELPPLPKTIDLSFDYENIHTIFRVTNFQEKTLVVLSNLGKIGHIIEVFFPKMLSIPGYSSKTRCDYETKLILGSDCSDFDLMIKRMCMSYHELGFEDNIVLYLGLQEFDINFVRKVVETFGQHLKETPNKVRRQKIDF